MLVIPIIHLRSGRCVRRNGDGFATEGEYFQDPVRMAKLWRVMNAPALHLIDHDDENGCSGGSPCAECVSRISRELDIPLQLSGCFSDPGEIDGWIEQGINRIVLDPMDDVEAVRELCGARRSGCVIPSLSLESTDMPHAVYGALPARRLFVWLPEFLSAEDLQRLRDWSQAFPRVRFTVVNGVTEYDSIQALQALEPSVDSVVLGKTLYENAFPCQKFWCWNQKENVDLDQYSTAPLAE